MAWRIQNLNRKKSGPPSTEDISRCFLLARLVVRSFGRSIAFFLSGIIIISFVCLVWFGLILFCLGVWVRGHYFEKRRIGVALHCRTLLVHWSGLHSTTLDDVRLDWVVTGLCVSVRLLPVLSYECLS